MLVQDPWHTSRKLLTFMLGMFGNSLGRGYHLPDNIIVCRVIGGVLAASTILLTILGIRRIKRRQISREPIIFWSGVSMATFCFVAAAFVAVGRTFRGYTQPLTPRYTTYGTFCVLALVLIAVGFFIEMTAELPDTTEHATEPRRSARSGTFAVILATFAVCLQVGPWTYGWQFMEGWSHARWTSLAALRFVRSFSVPHLPGRVGAPDEMLVPCLDTLDRIGRPLVEKRTDRLLLGFRTKDSGHPVEHSTAEFCGLSTDGKLVFEGRATLYKDHPADLLIVTAEKSGETPIIVDMVFPDSPPAYTLHSARKDNEFVQFSGPTLKDFGAWHSAIQPSDVASPGGETLRFWALDQKRDRLYRLKNSFNTNALRQPGTTAARAP